jgi:hypothetical protein
MARPARTKGQKNPAAKVTRAGEARVRTDKLSISLGGEDVQWVTRRAKRLGTSVSAVIAAAVADQRRAEARAQLLKQLGADDITDAEVAAARREAFGE